MKARFCSQCGEEVVVRPEDGREREVCSACATVFYRNPLPVVASVVIDRERRVLLVKRGQEPHAGMWCLPIGFAELGETIHEAALRELREEAGIEGEVIALLDADSFESGHYGDLLIVSFEVEKTGGVETPGDDAVDVRYFHLDGLPPLAFASNERALEVYVARHEEEWRIQDSFRHLQEKSGALLSDPLVHLIEEHAADIAVRWAEEVFGHHTTSCTPGEGGHSRALAARRLAAGRRGCGGIRAGLEERRFRGARLLPGVGGGAGACRVFCARGAQFALSSQALRLRPCTGRGCVGTAGRPVSCG